MKYAIAIDIGGTNIKYALVCENGEILSESMKASKSGDSQIRVADVLNTIVQELLDFASSNNLQVAGIGVGVPSVVDDGVVLYANNLPELDNQNIKTLIGNYTQLPVFVDNDANLMGLGEIKYGANKDLSDVVFLTIGTGVGGALFLNGQLYGGYRNRGTELGFIIINSEQNPRSCSSEGTFEAYASVPALIENYKKLQSGDVQDTNLIDGKYIVEKYYQEEDAAVSAMNNHFRYVAIGVASLINIFAPQKVIIGGGISEAGDFYIENIQKLVSEIVMKETSYFTKIERASLGNKAGFLGSAAMVFNHMNNKNR